MLVTDTGSLPELVREFSLGEVIRPDEAAIADGVRKIYSHYHEYLTGIRAYRKVANWKKVAEEHLRLYRKLA